MVRALAPIAWILALLASPAADAATLSELLRGTHVHGLAVDRGDPGRLLIATHHGFYAARTDGGAVEAVTARRDDFMGFSPHPTDAARLYASGHPAAGGNLGVIASEDGGRTWRTLAPGVGGPVDFHQMDVSKADANRLFGVHGGLQTSRDGGRTWERVGPAPEGLIDLAASATAANRLYAATQRGLLASADGGKTWRPAHALRQPVSLVETAADGTVYAFLLGSGLLEASEPTLAWRPLSNGFGERYLLHLAVDPTERNRMYAATHTGELLASRDGGRTWTVLAAP